MLKISALTGKGVHKLLPVLADAIERYHRRVPTRDVNEVIAEAQQAQPAPHGVRVLYALQGATDPPTFTLFANRELPADLPALPRAQAAGGVRPRRRADQAAGPAPLGLTVGLERDWWTISSRAAPRPGRSAATCTRRPTSWPARASCSSATGSKLLLDAGSFVEDGLLANAAADDLPADGVVTGVGRVDGRPVCVMANDPTVKAGSWGARTVEKIVRLTEYALRHELPVFWLVDSAGARITDQVRAVPRAAGARGGSSPTRCGCRARCPRSAACSGRRPPAAPTSRASATS